MTSISLSQAGEASSLQLLPDAKDTKMKPSSRQREIRELAPWRNKFRASHFHTSPLRTSELEVQDSIPRKLFQVQHWQRMRWGLTELARPFRTPPSREKKNDWSEHESYCVGNAHQEVQCVEASFSSRRKAEFPVDCIFFKSMIKERRVEKVCWFIWLYSEQLFYPQSWTWWILLFSSSLDIGGHIRTWWYS